MHQGHEKGKPDMTANMRLVCTLPTAIPVQHQAFFRVGSYKLFVPFCVTIITIGLECVRSWVVANCEDMFGVHVNVESTE